MLLVLLILFVVVVAVAVVGVDGLESRKVELRFAFELGFFEIWLPMTGKWGGKGGSVVNELLV